MESNRDERIRTNEDLEDVQKDIEKAASDRKSEIDKEIKDQKKSLKDEMKDLKDEAKKDYDEYKDYKKDSDDPVASEKISIAKETSKIVQKNIEADYEDSKDLLDHEAEMRKESIDLMLDDSDEAMEAHSDREIQGNRKPEQTNSIIAEPEKQPYAATSMNNNLHSEKQPEQKVNKARTDVSADAPMYEVENTLIIDEESDDVILVQEEREIGHRTGGSCGCNNDPNKNM